MNVIFCNQWVVHAKRVSHLVNKVEFVLEGPKIYLICTVYPFPSLTLFWKLIYGGFSPWSSAQLIFMGGNSLILLLLPGGAQKLGYASNFFLQLFIRKSWRHLCNVYKLEQRHKITKMTILTLMYLADMTFAFTFTFNKVCPLRYSLFLFVYFSVLRMNNSFSNLLLWLWNAFDAIWPIQFLIISGHLLMLYVAFLQHIMFQGLSYQYTWILEFVKDD